MLPLVFTNQVFETASLPRHILTTVVTLLLLFIFSLNLLINKIEIKLSYLHFLLLLFLLWALLSFAWSVDEKNSTIELTQLIIFFLLAFFASQLNSAAQIKQIFNALFIGAAIAAAIGILQTFNINPLNLKMSTFIASTFNNKNHACNYFDLIIPLALVKMLTTQSYEKYISSIAFTLMLTFILLAKTKGSLLGYLVSTLFLTFLLLRNESIRQHLLQKKKIVHYLFLGFIIPLVFYTIQNSKFIENTHSVTSVAWNTDLTKSSVNIRLAWYKNAYAMFVDSPILGVGYGGFREGFAPYASYPNIVKSLTEDQAVAQLHNDPYQIILELGIIGFIIILFIFGYIIVSLIKNISTTIVNSEDHLNFLLLGIFLALTSSITHSFFDFPLRLPSSAALFWFLIGITIMLTDKNHKKFILHNQILKRSLTVFILIFAGLLTALSFDLYTRFFAASKLTYQASVSIQKENDCSKGTQEIDHAFNLYFADAFIRQRYVQIHIKCDTDSKTRLQAMNNVLDYDSTNARARLTRALIYLENREIKLAEVDFNYLIDVLPHRPTAYLGMGDIFTLSKKYPTARKYYEKAKELDSNNQYANMMLQRLKDNGF